MTPNDYRILAIVALLSQDLLGGDLAELLFVVGYRRREACELAISPDLFIERCADPAADGVCPPGLHGLLACFDQLRVDRDRETLLLGSHTMVLTTV